MVGAGSDGSIGGIKPDLELGSAVVGVEVEEGGGGGAEGGDGVEEGAADVE